MTSQVQGQLLWLRCFHTTLSTWCFPFWARDGAESTPATWNNIQLFVLVLGNLPCRRRYFVGFGLKFLTSLGSDSELTNVLSSFTSFRVSTSSKSISPTVLLPWCNLQFCKNRSIHARLRKTLGNGCLSSISLNVLWLDWLWRLLTWSSLQSSFQLFLLQLHPVARSMCTPPRRWLLPQRILSNIASSATKISAVSHIWKMMNMQLASLLDAVH